jgi:hypothetical protein
MDRGSLAVGTKAEDSVHATSKPARRLLGTENLAARVYEVWIAAPVWQFDRRAML